VDHVTDAVMVMVMVGAHHLVGVVVGMGAGGAGGQQRRGGDGGGGNHLRGKLLLRSA
jgi:hypothetical protein